MGNGKKNNGGLGEWFKNNSVNCIGTLLTAIVVWVVFDISGKLGGLSARVDGVEKSIDKLSELPKDIAKLDRDFALLSKTTDTISRDVDSLRNVQQIVAQSFVQGGTFSEKTRIDSTEHTYRWEFQRIVDPKKVISIVAEPSPPLTGITVVAMIDQDGRGCTMKLEGSKDAMDKIPETISAQVVVSFRP